MFNVLNARGGLVFEEHDDTRGSIGLIVVSIEHVAELEVTAQALRLRLACGVPELVATQERTTWVLAGIMVIISIACSYAI